MSNMKVTIENAKVIRHINDKGYVVAVPVDGQDWVRNFTIWDKDLQPVDAVLNIAGDLSWKMRSYPTAAGERQTVDMNINNPIVLNQSVTDELPF